MPKHTESITTSKVELEVGECDCGYHFTADATYLDQVGDFIIECPSCGEEINTADVFAED